MGKILRKRGFVIILLTVVLLGVIVAGGFITSRKRPVGSGGMKIEKGAVEWTQDMKSSDENAAIQIPYYSDIYMENGSDEIDMYLVNPKENKCYFSYTFILKKNSEKIYQSGLIEPGKALDQVTLNRKFENGEYTLDMQIDTYTLEETKPLNNAIVSTRLIVK
ncbi:MAG: hypothetical protein Q4F21_10135 [Lachnospiraceae bacterium]|nr:hypothetical protein [Lachnospiraceae bacterium]